MTQITRIEQSCISLQQITSINDDGLVGDFGAVYPVVKRFRAGKQQGLSAYEVLEKSTNYRRRTTMAKKQTSSQKRGEETSRFEFEYVTSVVSLLKGDGIVVHVVNDSSVPENTRAVIYQNTGAGASTVTDSGSVVVSPTWVWGLGYTVSESGEYWLRIQATSEFLVPKASFERLRDDIWTPVVSYRPGDFAVFDLHPLRKRIW